MLGDVLNHLKFDLGYVFKWFKVNSLKRTASKHTWNQYQH